MNKVILSLGSNYGNRKKSVINALHWLNEILINPVFSPIYETMPIGSGNNRYLNCVCSGDFDGEFLKLNSDIKSYECDNGRDEKSRLEGLVTIDIDIVVWNDEVVRQWDFKQKFFQLGFKSMELSLSEIFCNSCHC